VPEDHARHFLPALMGSLHQQKAEGELILEQNDGTRRLYWAGGDLKYMRSDAGGEQFGNFLIRRGVLDMASLKALLADGEGSRVGDRVVQWGLMTQQECDERLRELLGSVLLHAMEHTILKVTWRPGPLDDNLSGDLQFCLDHRVLIWDTFENAQIERELLDMFRSEPDWRWQALPDLLEALSSLPLTPTLAYALSLLGTEPLGFDTIAALTGLPQAQATKLVATLWALGGLSLVGGDLPLVPKKGPPAPPPPPLPPIVPMFEPEIEITLEEEIRAAPEVRDPPRPMTLMDILEMDAEAPPREPFSPAGPPLARDPFSPAGPPPARDPFSPAGPPPSRDSFSPAEPPPLREPFPQSAPPSPTPSEVPAIELQSFQDSFAPFPREHEFPPLPSLPPMPSEENLSPAERAMQLIIKAKSYLVQNRTSEATRALEQAIKLDGNSPGAYESWLLLGRLRLSNPAWSTRAIEALQAASRLNPRAAEPWALMGELYHRKGFHANAQGCFRRALELDPSVAVPAGWSREDPLPPSAPKESQGGLMGKLRGMFGRDKG
jgi:tetratricopeptide (TPR) repeat protein